MADPYFRVEATTPAGGALNRDLDTIGEALATASDFINNAVNAKMHGATVVIVDMDGGRTVLNYTINEGDTQ